MTIESKSDFARRKGRSASAVGQWIAAGLIHGPAIVGAGRMARINVEIAEAQLAKRQDPGQRLGNGARADRSASRKPVPAAKPKPASAEPEPTPLDNRDEPDGSEPDYTFEKARLAKAQADAQEMKNAAARGEVLGLEEVVQRWSAIVSGARSALLAVPKRLRDVLPDLSASDLAKVDAEIRRALESLGDGTFAM